MVSVTFICKTNSYDYNKKVLWGITRESTPHKSVKSHAMFSANHQASQPVVQSPATQDHNPTKAS